MAAAAQLSNLFDLLLVHTLLFVVCGAELSSRW
jgi:hypothetical protein